MVSEVLEEVDAVCEERGRAPISRLLVDRDAPSPDDLLIARPADLDLAMFASAMAAFAALGAAGVRPDVVVGHSFGEMSALTAAGALGIADMTRAVCIRSEVLRRVQPPAGGMVALSLDLRRTTHLVGFLDEPNLVVAVDNGPEQCVVSGPTAALDNLQRFAQAAGVRAIRLRAAYPFHNPLLREANEAMNAELAEVPISAPRIPVYSPLHGGYLRSADEVRAMTQQHLLRPVMFYDGLLRLHRDGVRTFVESGGRETLTALLPSCLPRGVKAVAPLRRRCTAEEFRQALAGTETGGTRPHAATGTRPDPVPEVEVVAKTHAPPVVDEPREQPTRIVLPGEGELIARLRTTYAEVLGFPEELLEKDVDLEADLGIDSIRQLEAFDLARREFGLGAPSEELRVTSYTTLAELAGLLRDLPADDSQLVAR